MARLLIGAEPGNASAEPAPEHLQGCAACAEIPRGDAHARCQHPARAAAAAAAGVGAFRAPRAAAHLAGSGRWRRACWLACAATLGVWLLRLTNTLAHELVAHVEAEPDGWLSAEHASPPRASTEALRSAGVQPGCDLRQDHLCAQLLVPRSLRAAPGGADLAGGRRRCSSCTTRRRPPGGRSSFTRSRHERASSSRRRPGSIALLSRGGDVNLLAQEMQHDIRTGRRPMRASA